MRHQTVMNRMMEDWVITANNVHVLATTFGNSAKSTESAQTRKNMLEKILKSNGVVYSVTKWDNEQQRETFWIFRQKPVKSLSRLAQSTLKRKNVIDCVTWECKRELG